MVRREGGVGRRPSGSLRRQHGGDGHQRRREVERTPVHNRLGVDKVVVLRWSWGLEVSRDRVAVVPRRERDWMHDPRMVRREGGVGRRPSGSLRRQHGGDGHQRRRREVERTAVHNRLGVDKVVVLRWSWGLEVSRDRVAVVHHWRNRH